MNGLDWMFSAVLAIVFLVTGGVKVFRYELARERFAWVQDMPRAIVTANGILEIVGALGLILPAATGILPWLTPLASIVLGLLMLAAIAFHSYRKERSEAALSLVLMAFLVAVTYFRFPLLEVF